MDKVGDGGGGCDASWYFRVYVRVHLLRRGEEGGAGAGGV